MDVNKLKGLRVSKGLTVAEIAKRLDVTTSTYHRKEVGIRKFYDTEILGMIITLEMSPEEVNDIFFDNKITHWLIKG